MEGLDEGSANGKVRNCGNPQGHLTARMRNERSRSGHELGILYVVCTMNADGTKYILYI
jgi:hypothetical protein